VITAPATVEPVAVVTAAPLQELVALVARAVAIVAHVEGCDLSSAAAALGQTLLESVEDAERLPATMH